MSVEFAHEESGTGAPSFIKTYKDVVAVPGTGPWIRYPRGTHLVTIVVTPTGGTVRLEATTDTIENVDADTVDPDSIDPWKNAEASVKTSVTLSGVTAFRQIATTGSSVLFVSALS